LKGSLRSKIITSSFVPTVIILVAVALVNLYAYQQVTESLVLERDQELTRLSASLLGAELAAYTDPFAEQYMAAFDGVVLFDANGAVLAAEPGIYAQWSPNWFKDTTLHQILRSPEPVYTDVASDAIQGAKIVAVVMPITGRTGEPTGGVAGLVRLDPTTDSPLYNSVEKLRRRESNRIYLVDGMGRVIYHSNLNYIGEDFSDQAFVERVLDEEVGALRTRDVDGQEIVASFSPVPGTSWGLVTEESWAVLTASSRRFVRFLYLLLGLGVVAPTLIVTVGVRRITQPIAALIRAAQEIAGGNFSQRLNTTTGDELEELAKQFNLMALQLQESYAYLEQKVADRTKELATLNAIATEVSQSLDLEEILNYALDEVLEAMDMEKGQAFRLEEETQTLISMAHRGLPEELILCTARQPLDSGGAGQSVREGRPIVRDVSDYPEGLLKKLLKEADIRLVISAPLKVKGKTVGAIALGAPTRRSLTPEELSLLTAIGHQVGVAVENARLYAQAQQLAVLEERNRLARELHDSVTQALYGVTLCAEAAARQVSSGSIEMATAHLNEIRATTYDALREMRLLIFELRPPVLLEHGLESALQTRLDAVEGRFAMETELSCDGIGRLSADVEEGLYRIAQEALNNVLKHARASSVVVSLNRSGDAVTLEIADDGTGFDPAKAHECGGFGLSGMQERSVQLGGQLTVESSPGKGTRIRVEVCP
jgi:nitrate/nitrite-specific signal transduction histidine kinase